MTITPLEEQKYHTGISFPEEFIKGTGYNQISDNDPNKTKKYLSLARDCVQKAEQQDALIDKITYYAFARHILPSIYHKYEELLKSNEARHCYSYSQMQNSSEVQLNWILRAADFLFPYHNRQRTNQSDADSYARAVQYWEEAGDYIQKHPTLAVVYPELPNSSSQLAMNCYLTAAKASNKYEVASENFFKNGAYEKQESLFNKALKIAEHLSQNNPEDTEIKVAIAKIKTKKLCCLTGKEQRDLDAITKLSSEILVLRRSCGLFYEDKIQQLKRSEKYSPNDPNLDIAVYAFHAAKHFCEAALLEMDEKQRVELWKKTDCYTKQYYEMQKNHDASRSMQKIIRIMDHVKKKSFAPWIYTK